MMGGPRKDWMAPRPTRRRRRAALAAALAVTMVAPVVATSPPAAALGSVLYVAPAGTDSPNTCTVVGSPCRTITYALTQAAVGATINVSGTIFDRVVVNKSGITISGANAPVGAPAVIDGSAGGRVLETSWGVNLDRLTIRNGSAPAPGGAGIFSSWGTTRLTNVVVTGNVTAGSGGGIYSSEALVISNSTISGNTAQESLGGGGGIDMQGTAQITGSTIAGNSATNGGGIKIGSSFGRVGNVTLDNSTVSGNTASGTNAGDGGGIMVTPSSTLRATTSTLTGNAAADEGGGVRALPDATVTIRGTTIAGNKATFGGGVRSDSANITLAGSIVAANASDDCNSSGSGGTWVNQYSLVNSSACGGGGGTGVVSGDPVLAALATAGGATQTMALSVNSAAANVIPVGTTVSGVPLCPRTDQAGTVGPLDTATACSMGAREATTTDVSSPLDTLWVAAGGTNAANTCTKKATPCATVTYALSQVQPLAGAVTIRVSGTINDHISIPAGQRQYTITGAGAASPAVLDGSLSARVVTNAPGASFRLEHLRVQRGSASTGAGGGAILLNNGRMTLFNVTVADSTANMSGGGILTAGGTVSIVNSTITGNTTGLCGGCIGMQGGGGIYSQGTSLSIVSSTLSGNRSQGGTSGRGGGISTDAASTVTISGSTISGNTATSTGGGILAKNMTITNSTITGNTAATGGGGIWGVNTSVVKVTGSTIANNTSQSLGGGGVYVQFGTMNVGGSILSGNGGGNCTSQTDAANPGVVSVGYNLDSGSTCGSLTTGDVRNVAAGLGALTSSGGPTQTMLPSSTSPAIGRIPSGTALNGVTACPRIDQRGLAGPVAGQTRCTIGAAEPGGGAPPAFTSPAARTAIGGTRFSLPVTTSSVFPTTLSVSPSTPLPAGVLFTDGGNGQGTLAGYASPGTYTFSLQAANGVAPNATQNVTLSVSKRKQVPIVVTSVNGAAGTPLPLTATGGSGTGALTFSLGGGTAGCTLSGATLSATSAGTCTVTATKAADANFAAASSAPTTVTFVADELIANGGFEGSASPWVLSGNAVQVSADLPRTGTGLLRIGGAASNGAAYQTVSIPGAATRADLTFWLNVTSEETTTTTQYDKLFVEVRSTAGALLGTLATYGNLQKAAAGVYTMRGSFSLVAYKGQTVRVQLSGSSDSTLHTTFRVDDVSLKASTTPVATIGVSPATLSFTGQVGGANPASQNLSITNTGSGTLSWTASDNQPWLSVSPTSGTAPSTATVSVATAGLSSGTHNGAITLSANGATNTPVTVPVTLTVSAAPVPTIGVSPANLSFTGAMGGANPAPKSLSITNAGGGTLSWAASDDVPWLSVSPTSGTAPSTATVSVTTAGLSGGTHNGTITLSASGASNTPVTVPVTLTVTGSASAPITNGGFEASVNPWVLSGQAFWTGSGASPHAGTGYAYLGDSNNAEGAAYQIITIPSTATSADLTFWLSVTTEERNAAAYDKLFVEVRNADGFGPLLASPATFSNIDKSAGYVAKGAFSLLALKGQTVRLQFRAKTDGSLPTTFRIDDVSIA